MARELATTVQVKWTGDARQKMSSRGVMPAYEDGADWAETAREALNEYASIIKLRTREDAAAFLKGLDRVRSREPQTCTWMTGAHGRAYDRVYSEVLDALTEQGVAVDASGLGAPSLEWPEDEDEQDDRTTVADLLARDPEAHRLGELQGTEKQTAVLEQAHEDPEQTPAEVAEAVDCTERYAATTCERAQQ